MTNVAEPWTVRRLLEWTSGFFTRKEVDSPRLSAELLLSHVLSVPRIKLYTDYENVVEEKPLATFRDLVKRAGEHEPIAYLTGRAYFFNLEFEVEPGVLIPRPDTETLVENVLQLSRNTAGFEAPRVIDLCTGSGCIAAAIASRLKSAVVLASDVSEKAVEVARRNVSRLGLSDRVTVERGDLFEPLKSMVDAQPMDLVVANPPYIPSEKLKELDRNVREYEPVGALDGGEDGLTIHRRIIEEGAERLRSGGRMYLEIQFDQGVLATGIMERHGAYEDVRVLKDYGGNQRVVTGKRK
ncbi:MAG TPA: peptide chain release factor N(5)-glutamine methyltransferase [Tepidisphaeraceae bacterium]|jgi:release factor glutamine methyltransferase